MSSYRPTRTLFCLAPLVAAVVSLCPVANAAEFSIVDQRGSGELSEETRFYIDGHLVAQARLGGLQNETVMHVKVPDRERYDYSLCGSVTIRTPGGTETHEVNASGVLHNPDRHQFEAMGTGDYTGFYLVDRTSPLGGTVENRSVRSLTCAPPSS